jgi:hypothetical protein
MEAASNHAEKHDTIHSSTLTLTQSPEFTNGKSTPYHYRSTC